MEIQEIQPRSILTRTSGYLRTVCSHSLQPYRGCALGRTLCGVGCYAQHQGLLTRGRAWGRFMDVKPNAARLYLEQYSSEIAWARRACGCMVIFMSSSTEPFPPQERKLGVTRALLQAMLQSPPDGLIVQTHSTLVADHLAELCGLNKKCNLRVHISIETDTDRLPGLPGPAYSIKRRMAVAGQLKKAGLNVVITVAPLLPIRRPNAFFQELSVVADAVVIDHFLGGDGSANGSRTRRTPLPAAMAAVHDGSVTLAYRDEMAAVAERYFPGRVGLGVDGFAGRFRPVHEIQSPKNNAMKVGHC
jgi:DNA repair photolyase